MNMKGSIFADPKDLQSRNFFSFMAISKKHLTTAQSSLYKTAAP